MITVSRRDYHVAMLAAQTKMDGRRRAKGLEPLPRYELALIEAAPVASPMYRNRLAVERIGKRRAQQAAWRRRNREKLAAKSRTRRAKLKLPRLGYANAD